MKRSTLFIFGIGFFSLAVLSGCTGTKNRKPYAGNMSDYETFDSERYPTKPQSSTGTTAVQNDVPAELMTGGTPTTPTNPTNPTTPTNPTNPTTPTNPTNPPAANAGPFRIQVIASQSQANANSVANDLKRWFRQNRSSAPAFKEEELPVLVIREGDLWKVRAGWFRDRALAGEFQDFLRRRFRDAFVVAMPR